MTITLVQPYNADWPCWFEQIKSYLEPGLSGLACTIQHVGSTAIPGMVAKPIIDIDIVIPRRCFPDVKQALEVLGYVHQGDLGVPEREAFDLLDDQAGVRLPKHHLYVCETGVDELRRHLAFRDFMRQHPEWREKLNRLKRELCVKHNNDRQAYIDGKADMVEEITRLALECSGQMHADPTSQSARSASSEASDA
jgi:GrpB-like predicted nucleotidyltransferase (UPF0157 family)